MSNRKKKSSGPPPELWEDARWEDEHEAPEGGASAEPANGSEEGTAAMVLKEEVRSDVRTFDVGGLPEGEAGAIAFADAVNAAYRKAEARRAVDLHDLGTALNLAQDARLHERLSMTWERYLDERFDLPRTSAFELQRAARLFTREQVAALGISRANALASLPDDERTKLLPAASGMSVRQLRAAIVATKEPTTNTALAVREQSPIVLVHFPAKEGSTVMERIGPHHAIGVLRGMHGTALSLVLAPDENGELVMHVTPIGGSR